MTRPNKELFEMIENRRIRQRELAAVLKVSPQTVYRWLYNPRLPEEKRQKILEAIIKIS